MENINTAEYWNKVWGAEGTHTWRQYTTCFDRIVEHIGTGKRVLDVGGGVGVLANKLKQAGNIPFIIDISLIAVQIAKACFDVDGIARNVPPITGIMKGDDFITDYDYLVATEFLEHVEDAREFLREAVRVAPAAIYAVPDNTLDPEEEPEHLRKFDNGSLVELLESHYKTISIVKIRDRFYSGGGKEVNGLIIPVIIELPTLIAYCEV